MREIEKRKCTRCKETKHRVNFRWDKRKRNKRKKWCIKCERRSKSEDGSAKQSSFKNQGIVLPMRDYYRLVSSQKNLCKICGKPEVAKKRGKRHRDLSVDHNHNTGKVRGLLCQKCNAALGLLKCDDFGTMNLHAAIRYLKQT